MESVVGRGFGDSPDSQRKREQLFAPKIIEDLLRFGFTFV